MLNIVDFAMYWDMIHEDRSYRVNYLDTIRPLHFPALGFGVVYRRGQYCIRIVV